MSILWSFTPLDSCFFREPKPFNASEGGFLCSQFPPPAQTLAGSFRNTIGELLDVDWKDYRTKPGNPIRKVIGSPDNPHPLSFAGPYILRRQERLYPAPLHLLYTIKNEQTENQKYEWTRLQPGEKVDCDMGDVSLPEVTTTLEGGKLPEKIWLNQTDLMAVLNSGLPTGCIAESELVKDETRAGIGRDNQRSTVAEGLLYFVRYLRLCDEVSFGIFVEGMPDTEKLSSEILTRLGGEGRLANLRQTQNIVTLSAAPKPSGSEEGLILILLTHGDFNGKSEPDWAAINTERGVNLSMESACVGKPVREGGWDYAKRQPKPLKSLVPAGSSYFVKVIGDIIQAVNALHGKKIGNRTEFGYGEIAVGLWK
jgi:CRISPR-associated protein Cmr3